MLRYPQCKRAVAPPTGWDGALARRSGTTPKVSMHSSMLGCVKSFPARSALIYRILHLLILHLNRSLFEGLYSNFCVSLQAWLELEHVYAPAGSGGHLHCLGDGRVAYYAAAVGIVHSTEPNTPEGTGRQSYFCGHHQRITVCLRSRCTRDSSRLPLTYTARHNANRNNFGT